MLLPGLNLHPARLQSWEAFLLKQGCAVSAPALPGYGPHERPLWRRVTAGQWLEAVDGHARALNARYAGVPLSLLGFSMGALLGLSWHVSGAGGFARALLVSAPIGLSAPAMALAKGFSALPGGFPVPSWGSAPIRRHPFTSGAAYRALLELHGRVVSLWAETPPDAFPPRCHVFHPRDRLINTGALRKDASRHPGRVALVVVPAGDSCPFPRHLVLDRRLTGESAWRRICAELAGWLSRTAPRMAESNSAPNE